MSKGNYKAILFHPEGDFVTDFRDNKEKNDVWERINNMGSRWIFYPICFVGTDKTIVAAPEGLEVLEGKRISTVAKFFKKQWAERSEEICDQMNNSYPLNFIFQTDLL